jgi:cytosine/creatinine deaminase
LRRFGRRWTTTDGLGSGPRPSVAEPRRHLLAGVLEFTRGARDLPGVRRITLLGSLTTDKSVPKDADVLVVIDNELDLAPLARLGRRLKGVGQSINLGADIFLADEQGQYLGRICGYRECHPRALCEAQHCGRRDHLNDDLHVVTLSAQQVAEPPVDLAPLVVRRRRLPADVESLLLGPLAAEPPRDNGVMEMHSSAIDPFLQAAIDEARRGLAEGGIPIGSVLVHDGRIIGRGHNRRVQKGSAILHGEMDAIENAGRHPASVYRASTVYTTLSPCAMCSGTILLYGIPKVVIGENQTFLGEEALLRSRGVEVVVLQDATCRELMRRFIAEKPALWNEDIGEVG